MALTLPQRFQPGFRLIDGSQLNQIIDAINGGINNAVYIQDVAAGSLANVVFFVAPRAMQVLGVTSVYSVTNGAALTAQITKDVGTNAPGGGTSLLSSSINLNTTANTVINSPLVGTAASKQLAAGNRLGVAFTTTGTSLAGLVITVYLAPLVSSV